MNSWEKGLNEEQVEDTVSRLATQDTISPFLPELHARDPKNYVEYIHGVVTDLARFNKGAAFGISPEGFKAIVLNVHQEFIKTSLEQDYTYEDKFPLSFGFAFAKDPFTQVVRAHRGDLGLADDNKLQDFLDDALESVAINNQNAGIPDPEATLRRHCKMAKFLFPIRDGERTSAALAATVQKAVDGYQQKLAIADDSKGYPPLSEFLALARERVEAAVLDECIEPDDTPNGQFIRKFLKNPVEAMSSYYKNPPAGAQGSYFYFDNRRKQIEDVGNSWEQYRGNKPDRYAAFEQERISRFDRYIHEKYPNYNESTLKQEYAGGVLERTFLRTSEQWKNVVSAMESHADIEGDRGNLDPLRKAAAAYLKRKFPHCKPEEVTEEMCASLGKTSRSRALFCLTIYSAATRAKIETMNERIEAANAKTRELRELAHDPIEGFQEQFQDDLANNENNIENNNDNGIENETSENAK